MHSRPLRFPVSDWVAHHASVRPQAIALGSADTGEQVSWAQLEHRVGLTAARLRVEGLRPGDRLAVVADNDPRGFILQFAAMRAGVVMVPLNWRLVIEEMCHQCADAAVSALTHDAPWSGPARQVASDAGVRRVLELEALTGTQHGDGLAPMPPQSPDPDVVTHILYTSGTTGRPKGAVVSHASMMWNAFNILSATQVAAPGVHMLNPMPLFHAGGLNVLANPILMHGGRVTTMARWNPAAILAYIGDHAHAVTHLTTAPSLLQMLVDDPAFAATDFGTMRKMVIGGGATKPDLLRAFAAKGVALHPQYGGTETGPAALVLDDGLERALSGTCGKPVLHTAVRVVDPDSLTDVADGTVGELWLKGPAVTPGYWNLPNEQHFVDGWFRTGDAARRDADGYFHIAGRYKDMYKSGGENVYAAEVENVLIDLPEVADVAIIGVPDPKWGEVGLAVVVAAPGAEITLDGLRAACAGRIARYKHPQHLDLVDALPRNATGKVSKPALRERYQSLASLARDTPCEEPSTQFPT
ncbi:Long-chain-fatty-acid--CoA ligase [Mycobacterium talmoniae]|uniref:Long-chain-fatty-acid--CoA ligase FadD13 n=1 Tax=Mycobacterium talmoniae TaxID=1858794 RepID=A0A1S1NKT6_9MYCO|nr:feruloyl-CoA synthetase [Mycobacterium talmoniae]PQM47989.1 Long-chain-fatty-acid--CoA ligase [Mycobacterium talmoniae]